MRRCKLAFFSKVRGCPACTASAHGPEAVYNGPCWTQWPFAVLWCCMPTTAFVKPHAMAWDCTSPWPALHGLERLTGSLPAGMVCSLRPSNKFM